MSESDIENAIKDAEKYADEDKKRKEAVEVKNTADSLIYQTEKTLVDLGDNVSSSDKSDIEDAIKDLKSVLDSEDTATIKDKTDALQQKVYAMTEKMYGAVKGNQNQDFDTSGNMGYEPNEDYVEADYVEYDGDNQ